MIFFKKIVIFLILTLLGFNIMMQFSEHLVSELLLIRNRYYIENNQEIVLIELPLSEWLSQENKKEIIINNTYFDIKKVVVTNNEVVLYSIEDSFENILHFLQKSLAKKDKKETEKNRLKTKRILDFYYTVATENEADLSFNKKDNPCKYMQFLLHKASIKPTIKPPIA